MGTRAPDTVKRLVERFDRNFDSLHTSAYNETQLRVDYLDPLFESLGWDVANRKGYDQRYREVVHEDAVRIGGTTKAPDYCFRIGGVRRFFVEAKAPFRDIGRDPAPAFQLRRYAWTAKLPLSILTDFEEFGVYDTRQRPSERDKAGSARVKLVGFRDYEAQWEELCGLFSPEAIQRGAFERFIETGRKKGTTPVDAEFLKDIEGWRDLLARNIALRNPRLSDRQLNAAVQRTIDRIIFLRICEDRGIEPADNLKQVAAGDRVYRELFGQFRRADERYNSGLFHFGAEKGREEPDELTPGLKIDDAALKTVIGQLYYPSPYEFSVFPADILGQVYEQFLGKVIRLTAGHRAKVEEKPEVRKAGGVYYTPTYIVDYIVKNTVGKLLEARTPKTAAGLRILDPACGSGSFLLGAYQHLLDWHRDWYVKDGPQKHRAELYEGPGGEWRLTTQEKKRILLNNIYGVDIDGQAVEVTKLSLLLKVLEGESDQTITSQLKMFRERALPDLAANIKCGNSLIGSDFWQGEQQTLFADEKERLRINAFDWDREFPDIIKAGGFDAVIGNPPYIRMEGFVDVKNYLRQHYRVHEERSDLYAYFIEAEHRLLGPGGRFGMIVSNKFLRANYGRPIREFLAQNATVERVVDFAGLPVFAGATVRTLVLLTSKGKPARETLYSPPLTPLTFRSVAEGTVDLSTAIHEVEYGVSGKTLGPNGWTFADAASAALLKNLRARGRRLTEYCRGNICMGVKSGLTDAFVVSSKTRDELIRKTPPAGEILKPFLNGRDIRRYALEPSDCHLIYTHHGVDISRYPSVARHLEPYKSKLKQRATRQEWYELQQPQYAYARFFDAPKIVFPDIATTPRFALDDVGFYGSNTMYFIPMRDLYLLGLLNSRLAAFYFRSVCAGLEGAGETYLRFFGQYLEDFPVRTVDMKLGSDKAQHDKMVELVERMLELHKKLPKAKGEAKTSLERAIAATDKQIDELVYELYGLTDKEIAIVEGTPTKKERK